MLERRGLVKINPRKERLTLVKYNLLISAFFVDSLVDFFELELEREVDLSNDSLVASIGGDGSVSFKDSESSLSLFSIGKDLPRILISDVGACGITMPWIITSKSLSLVS